MRNMLGQIQFSKAHESRLPDATCRLSSRVASGIFLPLKLSGRLLSCVCYCRSAGKFETMMSKAALP